jgi:HK97 family phage major capsid protein
MSGKTIAEHLAALKATRDALNEKAAQIAQKGMDEGRSMNTAEAEEFDDANDQIKELDENIARYTALESATAKNAKAVETLNEKKTPLERQSDIVLKQDEKLEPGIAAARYAMCLIKAKGNHQVAFQMAEKHYPKTEGVVRTLKAQAEGADLAEMFKVKATVPAGTTTDSTWAAPLVYAETWAGDFINYLRPRTLIGQSQFRRVPFNIRIAGQTSGGTAGWVGQGKSKPVTKYDFNATTIPFTKVAAISVLTQELVRFSDPSAEALVRDSLADTVIARIDTDLFDPDLAAVSNVSPAGLLNGVAPVTVGPIDYTDPASVRCALAALWAPWDSTNLGARPAYYTTPAVARMLAFAVDSFGVNRAFPEMTPQGGSLMGVPVRVSQYLANNGGSGGSPFILVDESEIFLADDGSVTLDWSDQATIEMSDTPVGSSSATVTSNGSPFVNMWQTNSIALRAERFIWWGARRSGAIQWIDGMPSTC